MASMLQASTRPLEDPTVSRYMQCHHGNKTGINSTSLEVQVGKEAKCRKIF